MLLRIFIYINPGLFSYWRLAGTSSRLYTRYNRYSQQQSLGSPRELVLEPSKRNEDSAIKCRRVGKPFVSSVGDWGSAGLWLNVRTCACATESTSLLRRSRTGRARTVRSLSHIRTKKQDSIQEKSSYTVYKTV